MHLHRNRLLIFVHRPNLLHLFSTLIFMLHNKVYCSICFQTKETEMCCCTQVAARVTSDAEKDEWFVVKVINFDEKTKE